MEERDHTMKHAHTPILPLPASVVAQIAAGEVIERPATVVKELVENALDAGAQSISVLLEDGGRQSIQVIDDGQGIPAADLELAVQRHATSKLRTAQDFDYLTSFGFRGEALASISAVSHLTLQSRTAEELAGTVIETHFGQGQETRPIGMAVGTDVRVQGLFTRLPARRKFLKSASQERTAIVELVTQLSLSVPHVQFFLSNDTQPLLTLPARKTAHERIQDIYGEHFTAQLWPVVYEAPDLKITGFIGQPAYARPTGTQVLTVNTRVIQPSMILPSVRAAYASSIAPRTKPSFLLFLEIPPARVDVNVHPRKETILWHDEEMLKNTLTEILSSHLRGTYVPSDNSLQASVHDSGNTLQTLPYLHAQLKEAAPPWYHALARRERTILQVHNTYLISESSDGLLIVDQHAAHERVLYQEFLDLFEQKAAQPQTDELEKAVLIRLSPTLSSLLSEQLDTLAKIGYQIELFGEHTYRVCSVPVLLRDHSPQRVIEQMLHDWKENTPIQGISHFAHRTLAYLACRSAVKAGDPLTQDQAEVLLEKLQHTPYAFSCPHGRPTLHRWDWKDIEKLFHRR